MQNIYITKRCKHCNREMILITKELNQAIKQGRYLACMYCGSKNLEDGKETNDIKECFKNDEKAR